MKIIYGLISILLLYGILAIGTVVKNGVSLTDSPGIMARLKIFLSNNRATTSNHATFPELITPQYPYTSDELKHALMTSAQHLGWETRSHPQYDIHMIVTTRLLHFKDDIHITLTQATNTDTPRTTVNIISQSRKGRADFAANVSHIKKLRQQLEQHLP